MKLKIELKIKHFNKNKKTKTNVHRPQTTQTFPPILFPTFQLFLFISKTALSLPLTGLAAATGCQTNFSLWLTLLLCPPSNITSLPTSTLISLSISWHNSLQPTISVNKSPFTLCFHLLTASSVIHADLIKCNNIFLDTVLLSQHVSCTSSLDKLL